MSVSDGILRPKLGDLVLPTYYRASADGVLRCGIVVRCSGLFYDILWAGKDVPEQFWTTDDFYVMEAM
jgi:hypothetical protein